MARPSAMRRAVLRFSMRNRRRKAAYIVDYMRRHDVKSVLIIGAGGVVLPNAAIIENAIWDAADFAVASDLARFEGVPWCFVQADTRALPFRAGAFDLVVSNALIEHVGDEDDQRRCATEHARVGRSWMITTPNRWFPVESHTNAVLRHWSARWRASQTAFTRLLSRREFARLLPAGAVLERPRSAWRATFLARSEELDAGVYLGRAVVDDLAN